MADEQRAGQPATRLDDFSQRRRTAARASAELRACVESVLDPGTLVEIDLFAGLHADDAKALDLESETGVSGFGEVDGRPVAICALKAGTVRGVLAEVVAQKVGKAQEIAVRNRIPFIAYLEAGDQEQDEGLLTLASWAAIQARTARARGVVPQVCAAAGSLPREAQRLAHLCDFVVPVADVRRLLSLLPSAAGESLPASAADVPDLALDSELQALVPVEAHSDLDLAQVAGRVADPDSVYRLPAGGPLLTCFARLGGRVAGILAIGGRAGAQLDAAGAAEAARFVHFCDTFSIPVISLVDAVGATPDSAQAAGLLHAYAAADVPKLTVILRSSLAGAYGVLGSKQVGGDLVLAWPTADVGGPGEENHGLHHLALERGYVDDVIEPGETRRALVRALEICARRPAAAPVTGAP